MQGAHLVVHERNQRRHHQGGALARTMPGNSWNLVAQRFTAARGHEHHGVTATQHVVDDGALRATEILIPKHLLQDVEGVWR
jgi:hypothetical protein